MEHQSVMLKESIELLNVRPEGIYVDGTLGRGGHSSEILKKLTTGHLFAFDLDDEAIRESAEKLNEINSSFTLIKANYAKMKEELEQLGISGVDGILLDIGVSSPQFDDPERGFSYRYDAPLDMRMDQGQELTASRIVNEYDFNDLVRVIRNYGEEPFARQIARSIERRRQIKAIETTGELVEIIKDSLPAKEKKKTGHPAKRTFQALRIETNDELNNLKAGLQAAIEMLRTGGRLAVISFHSLEDEIVKKLFKKISQPPLIDKRIPLKESEIPAPKFTLITKKAVTATSGELESNRRAHSAKLRVIERRTEI